MECFGEFLAADDEITHPIPPMGEIASVGMGNVLSQEKREQVIRLHEQPLWILATLVERPGAIATREELQKRIWGKDTFVDFEQSLSKAVNRLREAVNDEPGQPR